MNSGNTSLGANLRGLIDDLSALIRQEFQLAKAEAGEKLEQVQTGVVSILVGMLIATCALFVLVQAVVAALSNVMPPEFAAMTVGVVLAVIAYVAIRIGERHLRPGNLAPRRTVRSLNEQASKMKESMQ